MNNAHLLPLKSTLAHALPEVVFGIQYLSTAATQDIGF
jgi:hypothetical protein